MKRVNKQEVKKALEKNSKSKSYCICEGCHWAFKITEEERKEYAEIQCANCKSFYLFYAFVMDIDAIIDPEPEQYCITCRGCGKPENECTCNVPTIDKDTQIIELQERITELEEQNEYLKEVLISPIEADHCIKALKSYWKGEECICVTSALAKLQKIIDKRG